MHCITAVNTILKFYHWYIEPPIHGMSSPLLWYYEPLPMAYRTPYQWNIEPSIKGISNLLPIVFWTPLPWHIEPHTHDVLTLSMVLVYRTLSFDRNEGVQFTMMGFKMKCRKCHMVYWTRGRFFRGSKYHMTPVYGSVRVAQSNFLCNVL
jgi:hypothetical protein